MPMKTPRTAQCLRTLAALVGLLVAGCIGAADPMPSPERPDANEIVVSSTSALRQGGPVDVVGVIGLAHAAPKAGFIELRQPFSDSVTVARASADGTFAAVFAGAAGDPILVSFRETEDGPSSDPVQISITLYESDAAPATPETNPAHPGGNAGTLSASAPQATAPDGRGRTHVLGSGLLAGSVVAVGNTRTGEVVVVTVPETGAIDVPVAASTGDTIVVIIRNASTGLTSELASLSVSAP
jgi:hypothetical protein